MNHMYLEDFSANVDLSFIFISYEHTQESHNSHDSSPFPLLVDSISSYHPTTTSFIMTFTSRILLPSHAQSA